VRGKRELPKKNTEANKDPNFRKSKEGKEEERLKEK
jgi:hypothetical protein